MSKKRRERPMSNSEILAGYKDCGLTGDDAFRDARKYGYSYQYDSGFAHGAIVAGVACIIGGAIDAVIANHDRKKNEAKMANRLELSRINLDWQKQLDAAKAQNPVVDDARVENNE